MEIDIFWNLKKCILFITTRTSLLYSSEKNQNVHISAENRTYPLRDQSWRPYCKSPQK